MFKIFAIKDLPKETYGKKEEKYFSNLCLYQIETPEEGINFEYENIRPPIPKARVSFGPNILTFLKIARPLSHTGPVIECGVQGEAKVVFLTFGNNTSLNFDLIPAKGGPPLRQRVLQSVDQLFDKKVIAFYIRTPSVGNYCFIVYSNAGLPSPKSYKPFCYYLVSSKQQAGSAEPFPKISNDLVGRIYPTYADLNVTVACYPNSESAWKNGLLSTDENGECILEINHVEPLHMVADLVPSDLPTKNIAHYTSVETTGRTTCIIVRTSSAHFGEIPFILKLYGKQVESGRRLPCFFVAMVFPSAPGIQCQSFPQSPVRCFGPSENHWKNNEIEKVVFCNSKSFIENKCRSAVAAKITWPHRLYDSGEDLKIELSYNVPLQLKGKLLFLDTEDKRENLDNFIFLTQSGASSAVMHARFPYPGHFGVTLFGCKVDENSNQLSPFGYFLINALKASDSSVPFPATYKVWSASARNFYCPMTGKLAPEEEVEFTVYLEKFVKSDDGSWSTTPYPLVLFVVDEKDKIHPEKSKEEPGMYRWKYTPNSDHSLAGLLVKKEEEADVMSYALQFRIN